MTTTQDLEKRIKERVQMLKSFDEKAYLICKALGKGATVANNELWFSPYPGTDSLDVYVRYSRSFDGIDQPSVNPFSTRIIIAYETKLSTVAGEEIYKPGDWETAFDGYVDLAKRANALRHQLFSLKHEIETQRRKALEDKKQEAESTMKETQLIKRLNDLGITQI